MYERSAPVKAIGRIRNALRPNVEITPPPDGVGFDQDVAVPMRDGVTLRVNIFRPRRAAGPFPVLMSAHPYGKDALPAPRRRGGYRPNMQFRLMPQSQPVRFSAWTGFEAPDPAYWVPRGYVVINADLRGWGTSDGVGQLLDMRQEGEDFHDLIEWAARQPWSNGRVGLTGVSYLAISQWSAAATRPPHLAAINPWEGFTDLYRHFARPGGIREDGFFALWNRMVRRRAGRRAKPSTGSPKAIDLREQQIARPEYDDWWASRAIDVSKIEVPALVCGSFSDHNLHSRGSFDGFTRISSTQKWLYTHRGPKWATYYSPDALAAQTRFFDHFLAGADNGQDEQPQVRLEVREDTDTITSVRGERQWPPAATRWQRLHLDAVAGELVGTAPASPGSIAFDTRRGYVRFAHRFTTDTEIVGPMLLHLTIEIERCADVALFAGLRKLRRGRPVAFENSFGFRGSLLTVGMRKAGHRRAEPPTGTNPIPYHPDDRADPPRPGEKVGLDIELCPSATLLRAGETLQLEVRGRWFYGRSPLTGQFPAYYEKSPRGRCILHTGGDAQAYLALPVQSAETNSP